jgi:nickel-type superoxide dismutase maturation protease
VRWAPFRLVAVRGDSMRPTYVDGDVLLVRTGVPVRPRSVVVANHPGRSGLLVIKRVVRREPEGWWLEGDNPDLAANHDSWVFGAVPEGEVVGRAVIRCWPWQRRQRSQHRS